jgi:hypothetical protein
MCEHLTEILAATAQKVALEYPVEERYGVARKFIDSVEIETMGDDIRERAFDALRTKPQSPAMTSSKRVIHQFANNREEITRQLEGAVMDPEVRERIITAYVGDSRPPISGAYVRKPGQAFTEGLRQLQEVVSHIGELGEKPAALKAIAANLPEGVTVGAHGMRLSNGPDGPQVKAVKPVSQEKIDQFVVELDDQERREEAENIVARAQQMIADNDQVVIEHLEDMLQDASEMRVGDTEEENGIKRSNTKKGPVLVLPTGIKVHRY